ncbi:MULTISPECIES: hypothetical protein [unclassified Streptomyces]|uniref:hypothetical protein n=1 Tax=unclassified Streptomyces TaxID=2593676 RepID=UPI00136B595F|nr:MULTISPECIES: hypothetical protein [unclassified Streptomyces]NEA03838.1 hypothetical protein [Streptomyces sp. SID10116]MYY85526.1 hypothetical protein [Streptomyces sp. SID335]MYZ15978.1 hypothetical protein [Streptomyces sp. SID337]NDZ92362.1 hypothetical protein [Streptomyces sp. SID10115]NEB49597.1 hypothetical protein [Streptomyces sp. SID339]
MDDELTNEDHLRALAALEAVIQNDDSALKVLAGGVHERPLAALLAAYGKHTLERVLLAAFGIEATMTLETGQRLAELNGDPMARIVFLLTDSLHQQAVLAGDDLVTAKRIGGSILLAIHAFTDADNQDALTLLRALRNEALQAD